MRDNRTTLLPCPFCGGEASKRLFYGTRYGVYCDECDARVGGLFNTEAEAVAAWNTRTHGTLTAEQVMAIAGKHQPDYCSDTHVCFDWQAIADELNARAERTCRMVEYDEAPLPVCSECGAVQPDDFAVYYCWSCGAKVVGE